MLRHKLICSSTDVELRRKELSETQGSAGTGRLGYPERDYRLVANSLSRWLSQSGVRPLCIAESDARMW